MKLWSENYGGNLHETAHILNEQGISDVVAMDYVGCNTIVVYRIADDEYVRKKADQKRRNEEVALRMREIQL